MKEGRALAWAPLLLELYCRAGSETIRSLLRNWIVRWEGGPGYSLTIRQILKKFHGVDVGLYTGGPCWMKPQLFHRGTVIGRYTFVADSVRTFTRNHPRNTKSTHGLFYNPALGMVSTAPLRFNQLVIGNGVWLGHNVIVLPPTSQVGDGAVLTAGAVVYGNVPPYAVVSGNPARVVDYRFPREVIANLLDSRWWESRPDQLDGRGVPQQAVGDCCASTQFKT